MVSGGWGSWAFRLGTGGRGGCWERESGDLSGKSVVLACPLGDQGPRGRIGGEDAVVTVAVEAGRRENLGEAVQELEGRQS